MVGHELLIHRKPRRLKEVGGFATILPTLTDVRPSSSDVLLAFSCLEPSGMPLILGRLLLDDGLYIILCGRDLLDVSAETGDDTLDGRRLSTPSGEPGGETIIL